MKSILLLLIFLYFNCSECMIITKYLCIDNDKGKSCQNKVLNKYQYISPKEFEKSVFNKEESIFIFLYTNITIDSNIMFNKSKFKLTISSNNNCLVALKANDLTTLTLSLNNIEIRTNLKFISFNSLSLSNCIFANDVSITSNVLISDSFSLKSLTSIHTEKLELTNDQNTKNKLDIFVTKGSNYHFFNQENPQILIFNDIDTNLIFGTNYIKLNNIKIISQIYPFIEIENTAKNLNLKCISNLIPNVLLTPIIHMISGKCNCYSSKWPQQPKKIDSYWEHDTFYDTNARKIEIILENSSSIHIYGKSIPISIKSNGHLSIYCESAQCGIAGQIYSQTPYDHILTTRKEKVTFHVNSIQNINGQGILHSKSSNIQIIIETCLSSFSVGNLSNYLCNSIDVDHSSTSNHVLNLAENGNILFHMRMNLNSVIKNLRGIVKFPPVGNIYDNKGDFSITAIIDYFMNKLVIGDVSALSIISSLKTLGNNIIGANFVKTKGNHQLKIHRNDILLNSLFYHNLYKYNKYLVCSVKKFNLKNWNLYFDDYKPAENKDFSIPFFDFNETNISFTTRNYQNNATSYCLQMKIDQYPNSAIEFLLYTNDPKLEGKFTWASGVFITFVSKRRLINIRASLSNHNAKNIVFIALNDVTCEVNFGHVRDDANVVIIGASLNLIDEFKKGFDNLNFDAVKPNINISYNRLNSIAYLFCKVNEKKANVKNFVGFASDIVNNDAFDTSAENVVFDLSTWKQIENKKNFSFKNFVLLPFELKPSIKYSNIQKVDFFNDKWRMHFANRSSCDLNYSTVSDRLLIMTGADKTLKLNVDKSFNFQNEFLKPIEIGYNIGIDKKLPIFSELPLLENQIDTFFSSFENSDNLNYLKIFKSIVLNYLNIKENSMRLENVVFEGDWNKVNDLTNNLVYISDNDGLEIENYPIHLMNKIYFSSKKNLIIKNIVGSSSSSKMHVKHSFPLLVKGSQRYEIPSNIEIEFENITILSKKSAFELNTESILVNHFKSSIGSSSEIKNNISIQKTVELEPNSVTFFESVNFSNESKIHFFYSLEKRYPLLVLKSGNLSPNSIILHHMSTDDKMTDEEIISNYASMPQIIFKKETKENRCETMRNYFVFDSEDDRFQNTQNKLISLFCEFAQFGSANYTSFGLNITVDVNEEEEFDNLSNKLIAFLAIFTCICWIVAVSVWCCLKKKKTINDDSNEPLNPADEPPINNVSSQLPLNDALQSD